MQIFALIAAILSLLLLLTSAISKSLRAKFKPRILSLFLILLLAFLCLPGGILGKAIEKHVARYEKKAAQKEFLRVDATRASAKANDFKKDKSRFIAHGGGAIEGKLYTNSLEALNSGYDKGFRLFELDISRTLDGEFVAVHDWEQWSQMSGYKGALPPRLAEFKSRKIYNSFTPLDMKGINEWFASRPDAVLITDKINSPREFSERFVDKNRLMMELFSWEAIAEARTHGVTAMATDKLLVDVDKIKEFGVSYGVADFVPFNKALAKKLSESGVKIYAFLLDKNAADENFALCHLDGYFYGIYADDFDFAAQIDCAK